MRVVILNLDSYVSASGMRYLVEALGAEIVLICQSKRFGGKYGSFTHQVVRNLRERGLAFVMYQSFNLVYYKALLAVVGILDYFGIRRRNLYSVESLATKYSIPYVQTLDPHDPTVIAKIRESKPDFIVSFYFDHIIRHPIPSLAGFGMLNVHTALLPNCKGAFPVFCTALNNLEAGFTIHKVIDETLDSGPVFLQKKVALDYNASLLVAEHRLMLDAARSLVQVMRQIISDNLKPEPQTGIGFYMPFPRRAEIAEIRGRFTLVNLLDYLVSL